MKVLVINAGSSSIKYQLYQMPEANVLAKGVVERIGEAGSVLSQKSDSKEHVFETEIKNHKQGMNLILETLATGESKVIDDIQDIQAVGHRVVHGGEEFSGSVVIDDDVIASIEKFADLAPLHNPPNLTGIKAAQENLPNAKQVACFDTAFHASIPKVAYMYGLPYDIYEKYRVRRYGFHGTSHNYVARRAAEVLGKDFKDVKLITCHLGNGCSITAVKDGKSIDTSMGLTPLEGVMMGTRCGDIDPAIIFYLKDKGYDVDEINKMCNKQSGLLGISGKSNDMRNLLEAVDEGDKQAELAVDMFSYRIKKYIGMYFAVLNGVDAIIFTGGIGENSTPVRERICTDLSAMGVKMDTALNDETVRKEGKISTEDSSVNVYIIPTDEEYAIAHDTFELTQ
ncbi:Acetate kinase [Anaerohalosphaera lusitana]|uniref:Acetate kinase n=1 Tax=Anaerohalosphaera lusitana TaxID=1936003 RepID=A0A1U9NN96_9BACT|nr:acetate kinase [Anaerohalosphaera lusitana]AQT68996.1 Acetate kinase [Anaerohalosphaera lusitana]